MIEVAPDAREAAAARLLELHPEGFEEDDDGLAVYTDAAGEERLRAAFGAVSAAFVEPGWEERWRDFHRPSWVGPLWIAPRWESSPPQGSIPVVVDPGRAFGTGSHPTTRLCLELLLEAGRGSLVDVGCGSGVLSIAAAKLGFDPVVALDRDAAAVAATRRNAAANDVEIEVRLADVREDELPAADVAVANIDLPSVEVVGRRVDALVVVTSGYFHGRTPALPRFRHVERRIDGGWAADRWEPK